MSFGNMSMRSRSASIPSSSHVAASYSSDGRSFTNPSFQETEGMASFTPLSSITTSLDGIPEVECPTQRVNPLYAAKMEKGISFSALKDEATVDPVKDSNNEKDSKKDQDVEGAPIPSLGKLSENSIQIDIDEPQEQEEHQTLCDLGNIKEEEEKEGGEEEEEGEGEEEGEKKAEPEMTLVNVEDEGKKDEEEDNMKEEEEDPLESLAKSRIGKSAQTEEQEDTSNVLGDLEKLDIDPFDI